MSVKLDHLIVQADDKTASATFLTLVLGLPGAARSDPFLAVAVDNDVTIDFLEIDHKVSPQHYAFMVDEECFQQVLDRIKEMNLPYWADPFHLQPDIVGDVIGGHHVYFNDPSGHNLEVLTG
jgi:catechol 2,3-dioxygenase-like lactoylglutathione lyase family enzyme